jgi:hypothetical protein
MNLPQHLSGILELLDSTSNYGCKIVVGNRLPPDYRANIVGVGAVFYYREGGQDQVADPNNVRSAEAVFQSQRLHVCREN